MDLVEDDKKKGLKTPVWNEYKTIVNEAEGKEVSVCNLPPPSYSLLLLDQSRSNREICFL